MGPITGITGSFMDYFALVDIIVQEKLCCRRKLLQCKNLFSVVPIMFCKRDGTNVWLISLPPVCQPCMHVCMHAHTLALWKKNNYIRSCSIDSHREDVIRTFIQVKKA